MYYTYISCCCEYQPIDQSTGIQPAFKVLKIQINVVKKRSQVKIASFACFHHIIITLYFRFCSTDSFCLIGSHSHRFLCVRISDGLVMWETRLGGRIEATCALSVIHKLIVVGKFIEVLELLS